MAGARGGVVRHATTALVAALGGVLLGVAIADRARALLARWLGARGATAPRADDAADAGDDDDGGSHADSCGGGSQPQSFRRAETKRRTYQRASSFSPLAPSASLYAFAAAAAPAGAEAFALDACPAGADEPGGSFRRASRRHSFVHAGLKGELPTVAGSRRARMESVTTSRGRIAEDASGALLSVELAADDARRMMASGRRDFSSIETILFVLSQITGTEAAQDAISSTSDSALQLQLQNAITTAVHDTLQRQRPGGGAPAAAGGAAEAAREIPACFTRARAPPLPPELTATPSARRCLERVREWDFDIFALDKAANGHALVALGDELMRPACEALGIEAARLHAFLSALEVAYRTDVPYHTALHAADVLHGASWLRHARMLPSVAPADEPLLELAILIAAAAHDVAHPGVNSDFLVKTADPLAVLYNDRSVLESMHAALCFRLLAAAETDLLAALAPSARAQVRAWVIAMILATDMKGHYALIARLGELDDWTVGADAGAPAADDLAFALGVLLHAADLGGPTKPTTVVRWSRRVAEEFFRQGEREQACGLKVSEGFERETAGKLWPQRNAAFVQFIVAPLFEAIAAVAPDARMQPIMDGVRGAVRALDGAEWSMPCL